MLAIKNQTHTHTKSNTDLYVVKEMQHSYTLTVNQTSSMHPNTYMQYRNR